MPDLSAWDLMVNVEGEAVLFVEATGRPSAGGATMRSSGTVLVVSRADGYSFSLEMDQESLARLRAAPLVVVAESDGQTVHAEYEASWAA